MKDLADENIVRDSLSNAAAMTNTSYGTLTKSENVFPNTSDYLCEIFQIFHGGGKLLLYSYQKYIWGNVKKSKYLFVIYKYLL